MPDSNDTSPAGAVVVSWAEFQDFFVHFFRWSVEEAPENFEHLYAEYFESHFPDPIERAKKHERLALAQRFLRDHVESFDYGKLAVTSQKEALVSKELLRALWAIYAHPSDRCTHEPPTVEVVRRAIEHFANTPL